MKQFFACLQFNIAIICLFLFASANLSYAKKLPMIDGKETVATVNGEPITLEAFNKAIEAMYSEGMGEKAVDMTSEKKAGKINFADLLARLINTKLLIMEGKNMGLHELPETIEAVKSYSKKTLMEMLLEEYVKDIQPEDATVNEIYEQKVREYKIKSILFKKSEAAEKIKKILDAGGNFDDVLKKAFAENLTKEADKGQYFTTDDLTIPVAQLVSTMKIGDISPILSTGKKEFIIFKLEDMRIPEKENQDAKKAATFEALNLIRVKAANDYYLMLKEKYIKVDQTLFDTLDYEAQEPGFDKLLEDPRVLIEVKGENPLTVKDFSILLKDKFYHGIEKAIETKRVNKEKKSTLEDFLQKKVLYKEALEKGIDKTEAYRSRVATYENSTIFGTFINKVVAPDIRLDEKEVKTFYEDNLDKFSSPKMLKIKNLIFDKKSFAEAALAKLSKGTDFNWLKSHAEGQIDPKGKNLLQFEGKPLILKSLPDAVQKNLSDAVPGDFRLYEAPDGFIYLLYVYHVVLPQAKPYDDVKKEITEDIFQHKLQNEVGVWAGKLKKYYPVKIYSKDLKQ